AADDGIALTRDALLDREGDELLARSRLADGAHGVGPDEARVLLARPPEPGFDRPARLHQVVAVEVVADLEAQGVAGAEPRGDGAAADDRVPDPARVLGRDEQLDALLARVARAADEHARRADLLLACGEARRQRPVGERLDDLAGERPLDGEHREVVEAVLDLDVEVAGVATK